MEHIYFIGGVGKPGEFGGEASKNKEIVRILSERGYDVTVIDTLNSSKNLLRLSSPLHNNLLDLIWQHLLIYKAVSYSWHKTEYHLLGHRWSVQPVGTRR